MRSIFINYRRNDSEGEAGRLFDDLASRFGDESVFMDVAAIEPGRDFRKAIDQSVANCSVLLAIIGLEWLEAKDCLGRTPPGRPQRFCPNRAGFGSQARYTSGACARPRSQNAAR